MVLGAFSDVMVLIESLLDLHATNSTCTYLRSLLACFSSPPPFRFRCESLKIP